MWLLPLLSIPLWLVLAHTLAVRSCTNAPSLTWKQGAGVVLPAVGLAGIFLVLTSVDAIRPGLAFIAIGTATLAAFEPMYRARQTEPA